MTGVAATQPLRGGMATEARAVLVLALFVCGVGLGVVAQRVTDTGPRENPWPSLERVEEPQAAADVAAALANNDAKALAALLDQQILTDLRDALTTPTQVPMAEVRNVKFVGATGKEGRILAGYIVTGKDMEGADSIVGVVLDVENGEIVGVN